MNYQSRYNRFILDQNLCLLLLYRSAFKTTEADADLSSILQLELEAIISICMKIHYAYSRVCPIFAILSGTILTLNCYSVCLFSYKFIALLNLLTSRTDLIAHHQDYLQG